VGLGQLVDVEFEAVIFDMDGTLIDSTPAVERAWTIWATEHGLTRAEIAGNHGVPSAGVVRKVLPEHRHESAIARINRLELEDLHDIVVLPGAAEALAALTSAKNAIATSCTIPLARARIAAAALVPPSVLVTADDVARGKPAPDPFLEAAKRLGVDPTRCLVVEDAPAGLTAAKAAGCHTLAVVTTTPIDELDADGIVPDLASVRFRATSTGIRVQPA
jgi:sugar-phosphatase